MEMQQFVDAANHFDTEAFLALFIPDAILDDPSVGSKFVGHAGIRDYFESYFIGYQTQTRITKNQTNYLEVEFKGTFPGGKIGGSFEFTFNDDKIAYLKADIFN